mmetsp:Transcript_6214/g.795  ORF Transcript_6214/g.795 Transcript_6214/m.795 type:complete len:90 (+) Transcript_6214:984-1253(+)
MTAYVYSIILTEIGFFVFSSYVGESSHTPTIIAVSVLRALQFLIASQWEAVSAPLKLHSLKYAQIPIIQLIQFVLVASLFRAFRVRFGK